MKPKYFAFRRWARTPRIILSQYDWIPRDTWIWDFLNVCSPKLKYPIHRQWWRWVFFPVGGICDHSLEGLEGMFINILVCSSILGIMFSIFFQVSKYIFIETMHPRPRPKSVQLRSSILHPWRIQVSVFVFGRFRWREIDLPWYTSNPLQITGSVEKIVIHYLNGFMLRHFP